MKPTILFNQSSITNTSLVNFTIDTQVTVAALGLPEGASVQFEMVQLSSPTRDTLQPGCCEVPLDKLASEMSWQPLMCCEGQPVRVNSANPFIVLDAPQAVRLRAIVVGYDFSAAPFSGEIIVYKSTSTITSDTMRGCCPDPIVVEPPPPPVTAVVSICPVPACFTWGGTQYNSVVAFASDIRSLVPGATYNVATCTFSAPAGAVFPDLTIVECVPEVPVTAVVSICPVPTCFTWGGTQYNSVAAFVNAVKDIVPGAVYNAQTCTFSAPEGSVFPDLTIVECVPETVYCPSLRLDVCDCNEIGFAYRDGDSIDPAATVQVLACDGTTVGYAYPTARVGATVPYEENNIVIGFLKNRSECAPEASTVINNYVNTTVAAPTVVLPAPTVASQTLDANDAIVTTLTNGTVFTTPLSNC